VTTVRSTYVRASLAAAAAAAVVVISGCGAARTVSQAIDPVAKAAETTSQVQGYRMSGVVTIDTGVGPVKTTMSGVMNRVSRTASMITKATVAGHAVTLSERLSGLTVYMDTSAIPGADQLTHGKPWLKMDMSRAFTSFGLGSSVSATSSDPSQFVDYLRAVSDNTKNLGAATIRGVPTTHYHAVIDLSKYPGVIPAAQRATAQRGIKNLETAIGRHTIPTDVWIDHHKLVRQMSMNMPECVNNQKVTMSMTMDMYDYGPQPATQIPPSAQTYDLTPLISASMKQVKLGCSTSSS
jgi:hypothetical protein